MKKKAMIAHRRMPHLIRYFVALIVIAGLGWIMTEAAERFGLGGIVMVSATYALWFILVESWKSNVENWDHWQEEIRNDTNGNLVYGGKRIVVHRGDGLRRDKI